MALVELCAFCVPVEELEGREPLLAGPLYNIELFPAQSLVFVREELVPQVARNVVQSDLNFFKLLFRQIRQRHHRVELGHRNDTIERQLVFIGFVLQNKLCCKTVHRTLLGFGEVSAFGTAKPPVANVFWISSKNELNHLDDCGLLPFIKSADIRRLADLAKNGFLREPVLRQHNLGDLVNVLHLSQQKCARRHPLDVDEVTPAIASLDLCISLNELDALFVDLILEDLAVNHALI